jgi:hypothetical protein
LQLVREVLDLLERRDEERRRLAADLARLGQPQVRRLPRTKDLHARLGGFLNDWHALLEKNTVGNAQRALRPLLSKRLRQQLDDAVACQADWVRQQPKGSTDKPPFVECCLFTSSVDGMPTSFELGPIKVLRDGGYQIMVDFVRNEIADAIKWRDAVVVIKEGDHFALDDVIYDAYPWFGQPICCSAAESLGPDT